MTHISTSFTHHAATTIGVIRHATSRAANSAANIGIRGVHRSRHALADGLELLAARVRPKTKQPKLHVLRTEAPRKKAPVARTKKATTPRKKKEVAEKKPVTPATPPAAPTILPMPAAGAA